MKVLVDSHKVITSAAANIRTGRDGYTWGAPVRESHILRGLGVVREVGGGRVDIDHRGLQALGLREEDVIAELWLASDDPTYRTMITLPGGSQVDLSTLLQAYGQEILGEEHVFKYGPFLGTMMKYIDAHLSLTGQLHRIPGDPKGLAKPEVWKAGPGGARLYFGWNKPMTPDTIRHHYRAGTLEGDFGVLNLFPGQLIQVPGGTVHAIREGTYLKEWSHTPTAEDIALGDLKSATLSIWDRTDGKQPRPDKEQLEESIDALRFAGPQAFVPPDSHQFTQQPRILYTDQEGNGITTSASP